MNKKAGDSLAEARAAQWLPYDAEGSLRKTECARVFEKEINGQKERGDERKTERNRERESKCHIYERARNVILPSIIAE
jgi:hypothetical protein